MDYRTLIVHQVYDEAEHIADDARTAFGQLNAHQLNWKAAPDLWSLGQCFDCLIAADRAFDPGFEIVVAHERRHMAQARRVMASDGFPPCAS